MAKVKKMAFGGRLGSAIAAAKPVAKSPPAPSSGEATIGGMGLKGLMNQPGMEKRAPLTGEAAKARDAMAQKLNAQMNNQAAMAQKGIGPMNPTGSIKTLTGGIGPLNAPGAKPANYAAGLGGMGAAMQAQRFGALKGGASSASSGPMAKADPLRKIGSGPSRFEKMKKGGSVSSASKRADGCAVKGKTKGRMV